MWRMGGFDWIWAGQDGIEFIDGRITDPPKSYLSRNGLKCESKLNHVNSF